MGKEFTDSYRGSFVIAAERPLELNGQTSKIQLLLENQNTKILQRQFANHRKFGIDHGN